VTVYSILGLLSSLFGGLLQASIINKRSGKVIKESGDCKVLIYFRSTISSMIIGSDIKKYNSNIHVTESVANAVSGRVMHTGSLSIKIVSAEDGV
jgi:hypothetical protein